MSAGTDRRAFLALSDERGRWWQLAWAMWREGYRAARAIYGGSNPTHHDLLNAYFAGQRTAHASNAEAFDAGVAATLDRFANEIGGRSYPAHPTPLELKRWTRHAPRCRHGGHGGSQSCQRAGCIPGPREDYAKAAPWDIGPDEMRRRAAASWEAST
jgi:hypothetical protein